MSVHKLPLHALSRWYEALQQWFEQHPGTRRWLSVLRLGLFQFGMGLSIAPLTGTLNRVLIDEVGIAAVAVGFLIAIHYFVSPIRAMIGFRSDQERVAGRWRTPYVVFGAMLTYGGLATAPFSLILLSGDGMIPIWLAMIICTLIFLAYGVGVNIVETVFLALVSDITEPKDRGKVLAVLWVMLVLGTVVSSIIISYLLHDYTHTRLIRVMQGSAVVFIVLALVALWNRERLNSKGFVETPNEIRVRVSLGESIKLLFRQRVLRNLFVVLFLATAGFATHDVLLEPYGGQVLDMTIAETTQLTALWGISMLLAITVAGWMLWKGRSAVTLIMLGTGVGALGFLVISIASDAAMVNPFRAGVSLIGIGRGLFIVASIALVMSLTDMSHAGLFIGLWGVMQALAQGFGTIGGGLARDIAQFQTGSVVIGYTSVYGASLVLLVVSLGLVVALRLDRQLRDKAGSSWEGLQDIPADQIVY
jgi:BCD family chlorophyll transporter-like MFS transporter